MGGGHTSPDSRQCTGLLSSRAALGSSQATGGLQLLPNPPSTDITELVQGAEGWAEDCGGREGRGSSLILTYTTTPSLQIQGHPAPEQHPSSREWMAASQGPLLTFMRGHRHTSSQIWALPRPILLGLGSAVFGEGAWGASHTQPASRPQPLSTPGRTPPGDRTRAGCCGNKFTGRLCS